MRLRFALALPILLSGLAACSSSVVRDSGTPEMQDSGLLDATPHADAGLRDATQADASPADALAMDAVPAPDAEADAASSFPDAAPVDAEGDAGSAPDATFPDATFPDATFPDAAAADASPADVGFGPGPLRCVPPLAAPPTAMTGRIFSATSYSGSILPVFEVSTGTAVQFARVPAGGYLGPVMITRRGQMLITSHDSAGSLWDITAGGTFTSTRGKIAQNLFPGGVSYIEGFALDDAGRFYVANSERSSQIAVVTTTIAGGQVHYLPRVYNNPSSLVVCDQTLVIAEGGSGRIRTFDLNTRTSTSFAFGFQVGNGHISAQPIVDHRGHLLVDWANAAHGQGIYDVTAGGDLSAATPLIPVSFSIDSNQLAINPNDDLFSAGASSGNLWVSRKVGGVYTPFRLYARNVGDNESVAIGP